MSVRQSGVVLCSLLALAVLGCTAFPVVDTDVCGNAAIEDGEDCDTFAKAPLSCRPPGTDGACHYDCRLNADGTRAPCPDGSGCAADGICRKPTGGFDQGVNFASDASSWVSTVDFDGDGKRDVLSTEPADEFQQARFRLHYFDVDANLVETRTFPRSTTRPIARHVSGDSAAAELLFSNSRIGLLPGRHDREWVPLAFSSYVVPDSGLRVVGVRKDFVSSYSPLVALTTINGVVGAYVPDFTTGGLGLRLELPKPVSDFAGVPIAADVIEGVDSPCGELVVAYMGARDFRVYDMCAPGDEHLVSSVAVWRDTPEQQIVALPAGLVIDAGPLVADVDGDGHLDILIGAGGHPYLALGNGHGLEPVAGSFELDVYADDRHSTLPSTQLGMPLAAGDYSGDGVADFVLPHGLLTSRKLSSSTGYFESFPNSGDAWTMAEIADLNGNGLPDVVAASAGAYSLSFFNGTGGPFQIGTTLATQGPVRLLTTGDFDGDLVGDVAFMQSGSVGSSDSLALAFGIRDGAPLPATRVAEVPGVNQLGDYGSLGLDNLFVASDQRVDGVNYTKLTLFDNGANRLPFAPYSLVTFSTDLGIEDSKAPVIVAGAFTKPDVTDVIALGAPNIARDPWGAWLLADIDSGRQQPRLLTGKLPDGVAPINSSAADGRARLSVVGTAADVDGDHLDESLWLASRGAAGCSLFVASIDAEAGTFSDVGRVDFDQPCPSPELSAADLDGDGAVDLLVLLGDPDQKPRQLELLWNDGHGGFSEENRSLVGAPKGHDVRGFSVFAPPPPSDKTKARGSDDVPNVPAQRLALVSDSDLFVVEPAIAHGRTFDVINRLQSFHDARSVVVTDPNGDGIEDLAVADAAGLWLVEAQLR